MINIDEQYALKYWIKNRRSNEGKIPNFYGSTFLYKKWILIKRTFFKLQKFNSAYFVIQLIK